MLGHQITRYLESIRRNNPMPVNVALWDGTEVALGQDHKVGIRLTSTAAARYLIRPSMKSLGEGYVEGHLDVAGKIHDILEVAAALSRHAHPDSRGRRPGWLARHTRNSDRKAIAYHYDVSNEFYSLWLDPQMVYSCAYFDSPQTDLATAQTAKLDHICRKLKLSPGMAFLDIGCGWGALALHAARHYGVRAIGITLSTHQAGLARQRVLEAGLQGRVEIRLQDYRDLPESTPFDRIASVGMFEHVGLKRLSDYFRTVTRLLKPGGITLMHGITSSDADSREVGMGAGEFIERYVFPDGELPHVSLAIREMSAAGLEVVDVESLRRHYALTLEHWSAGFEQHFDRLEQLVGAQRARIWRVYLAGSALGFARGWMNIYQMLAIRSPDGASPLPLTRDFIYRPR
jgi:cyclopropane-fatty-acyl-phospholipid synthase